MVLQAAVRPLNVERLCRYLRTLSLSAKAKLKSATYDLDVVAHFISPNIEYASKE